jgi:hypothetical protein
MLPAAPYHPRTLGAIMSHELIALRTDRKADVAMTQRKPAT